MHSNQENRRFCTLLPTSLFRLPFFDIRRSSVQCWPQAASGLPASSLVTSVPPAVPNQEI